MRGGVGGGSADCDTASAASSAATVLSMRLQPAAASPDAPGGPSGSGGSASTEVERSRRAAGASAPDGVNDATMLLVAAPRARAEAPSCSPAAPAVGCDAAIGLKRTSDRLAGTETPTVTRPALLAPPCSAREGAVDGGLRAPELRRRCQVGRYYGAAPRGDTTGRRPGAILRGGAQGRYCGAAPRGGSAGRRPGAILRGGAQGWRTSSSSGATRRRQLMSGSYTKASSMAMTLCRLSRSTPMVDSHVERKLPSMPLTWLG